MILIFNIKYTLHTGNLSHGIYPHSVHHDCVAHILFSFTNEPHPFITNSVHDRSKHYSLYDFTIASIQINIYMYAQSVN